MYDLGLHLQQHTSTSAEVFGKLLNVQAKSTTYILLLIRSSFWSCACWCGV